MGGTYIEEGVYYDNSKDVLHFVKDAATGIYESTPDGTSIGLAMFINSSKGVNPLSKNCNMRHVECTMVEERNRSQLNAKYKYKCVVTSKVVYKGQQFVANYNVDASDARIKAESLHVSGVNSVGKRRGTSRAAVDLAPKNFNAGVVDITTSSRTRKRAREELDAVHAVDELHEPSKRTGRGKDTRKRARCIIKEPKLKKEKAPKKEKTPKKQKAVVVVEKVTQEVDPEKSELGKQLAIQKAHLESVFATEKERIVAELRKELETEWMAKFTKEKELHASMLTMSELRVHAQHADARSELQSILNGCQIEILGLQQELEPFLREREEATMLSHFIARDAAHITDNRVNNYRASEGSGRQPLSQQRVQQLRPNTEPTLLPALPPPPTQPTLLPPLILPALPAPPTQPALLPPLIMPALPPPPTQVKTEDQNKNGGIT